MHLCNLPQHLLARLNDEKLADDHNIWMSSTFWQPHLRISGKTFQVLKKCRPRKDRGCRYSHIILGLRSLFQRYLTSHIL